MIQKQTQIKLLVFLFLALTSFSCEKDLYEDAIANKKLNIKEIALEELYNQKEFNKWFEKRSYALSTAKSFSINYQDFILSDQNVKVIETDSITSYTILI